MKRSARRACLSGSSHEQTDGDSSIEIMAIIITVSGVVVVFRSCAGNVSAASIVARHIISLLRSVWADSSQAAVFLYLPASLTAY